MNRLLLHEFHEELGGRFFEANGMEAVQNFGDARAEHAALLATAGALDLSFRGRLCVLGTDRATFLNGQVTNDVKGLRPGQGCYAALVTARGKMESDLNIYCLDDELLLDIEPGFSAAVRQRLEKYIIAEDAQVADASPDYGLLSVQGPQATPVLESLGLPTPEKCFEIAKTSHPSLGEIHVANQPRIGTVGYDIYVPAASLRLTAEKLLTALRAAGGRFCGWDALENARIEAGIPRFGADMDITNLPPEAGLDGRAISYTKGCYIGQEVIARIRTYGQVAKSLRGLSLATDLPQLPVKGAKLFQGEKEMGVITSAADSMAGLGKIALGYVRREAAAPGTELWLEVGGAKTPARVVALPFISPSKTEK